MTTILISDLRVRGACEGDLRKLEGLYPSGIVTLHPSELATLLAANINILWGTTLLPEASQIALAKQWFDRALAGQSRSWKTPLRGLIDVPGPAATAIQHVADRLVDRAAAATDLDRGIEGVGYAYATVVKKISEGGSNNKSAALLAQWTAVCAALVEAGDKNTILDELKNDVLTKLDQDGVAP